MYCNAEAWSKLRSHGPREILMKLRVMLACAIKINIDVATTKSKTTCANTASIEASLEYLLLARSKINIDVAKNNARIGKILKY